MHSEPFSISGNYYDLFYREKEYVKEAQYVIDILNLYDPQASEILELGSGTGNYSQQFINSGFKITGVERNRDMVALAKKKCKNNFTPVIDDITSFELPGKFDAAISLFHVISYLSENEMVLACFKQVAKHMVKKGIFIFDAWYTPAVYTQLPQSRTKHISTDLYNITRVATPVLLYEQNLVEVNYLITIEHKITRETEIQKETHVMRHFSTPEIKFMAQLAGFTLVKAEAFLTAKEPCADTWGVCYILQKNG